MVNLREGGIYRTRAGNTVGPLYKNNNHTAKTHPWRADGSGYNTWTSTGRYGHANRSSVLDIVEEVSATDDDPHYSTVEGNLVHHIARRSKALEKLEEANALLNDLSEDYLWTAITRLRNEIDVLKKASDILGAP